MLSLARILRQEEDLLEHQSPFLEQAEVSPGETATHHRRQMTKKNVERVKFYPAAMVFNFWKFLHWLPETSHKTMTLLDLCQWFSTRGSFGPQEIFGNIWSHFWVVTAWERGGCYWHLVWVEARVAAKHPTLSKTALDEEEFTQIQRSVVFRLRNPGCGSFSNSSSRLTLHSVPSKAESLTARHPKAHAILEEISSDTISMNSGSYSEREH